MGQFWLINPLEGSMNFYEHWGKWTVNIALIRGNRPALGVVYAPAYNRLYTGHVQHNRANVYTPKEPERRIRVKLRPEGKRKALIAFDKAREPDLSALKHAYELRRSFSPNSSYDICRLAEGQFDLFAQWRKRSEWNIAAAQAVAEAAGASVSLMETRQVPQYGNRHNLNWGLPPLLIASDERLLKPEFTLTG
jgi:3'(2'), 5'-bisphosphate nucleotidase